MNKASVLIFIMVTALLSGITGYKMSAYKYLQINKIDREFDNSNKNIDIILNLKILKMLKNNKINEAVEWHEKTLAIKLKDKNITKDTLNTAKEYQKKYCSNKCLGM